MIEFLRTPVECFENLPSFPYEPHYIDNLNGYDNLRMHYIDEGSKDANEVFLCLHGQPTWSYLYRKMIPIFLNAGHRVVAPDYFGFGRSDKPIKEEIYTFDFHRESLIDFIKKLDLKNITLVCQDWGGLLGLTLPMDMPTRFSRLLIMNTWLGVGDVPLSKGFLYWREWNNNHPDLEPGRLIAQQCPQLTDGEKAAYNAPFPDIKYKAGIRRFPNLVPDNLEAPGAETSRRAREWLQNEWFGESFMAVGMQDPVLGPSIMRILRSYIKGCPKPLKINEAAHFVQEWGEEIAKKALEHFHLD
ncbi:MAG: alpha/beta fold hydrolase [Promethearchaeota archaeon]|nr:MAG: alpha/beta fold hydrolase [Candidatus Lokiarchaeota archaeon]